MRKEKLSFEPPPQPATKYRARTIGRVSLPEQRSRVGITDQNSPAIAMSVAVRVVNAHRIYSRVRLIEGEVCKKMEAPASSSR